MSLVNELLDQFEPEIAGITLIPSSGGRFEVVVNEMLLYSKLGTGRHAEPGEVAKLVGKFLKN